MRIEASCRNPDSLGLHRHYVSILAELFGRILPMHVKETSLKPLSGISLTAEENTLLKWLRSVSWEPVTGTHGSVLYKAKAPEFFGGVRLYRMQAAAASNSALGALELFIRKLSLQGIISKQELYPLSGHGNQARYLSLKKADLENLGVGGRRKRKSKAQE